VSLTKIPVRGECVRASVCVSVHERVGVHACSCVVRVYALVQVGAVGCGRFKWGGVAMSTDSVVQ
jgi:hypothetical protein